MLRATSCFVALCLVTGCAFVKLEREVKRIANTAYLQGQVSGALTPGAPIYVVHVVEGKKLSAQRLIPALPEFALLVRVGVKNQVAAFQDLDGDRFYDRDEPSAFVDGLELRPVSEGTVDLPPLELQTQTPLKLLLDLRTTATSTGAVVGELVSLDDPRFDDERVQEGLWSPLKATSRNDYGLQLLEPHQAGRIPVLFVHGINGSPRNFKKLIERLDRTKYEPWVASYPSGLRLPVLAEILAGQLQSARDTFHVDALHVVAHSMGGLVAKGALLQLADKNEAGFIKSFVTLATPWGGHPRAQFALDYAPEAVPSWIDLAPKSRYLASLERPLPSSIKVSLYFAVGKRSDSLDGNNDGVVPLASQLPTWAQDQASVIYGFDVGHADLPRASELATKLWNSLSP
ncbi:MAG: hypothetical protein U0228_33215 [Myxococcaceae bacterium]